MAKERIVSWTSHFKSLIVFGLPFFWVLCLFLFMNVTSPLQNGPLSIVAVFIFMYLTLTSTLYALVIVLRKILTTLGYQNTPHGKQVYYLVSVIGLGPVFIIALNTLGKLEVREVILVAILVVIGCFYTARRIN